MTDYRAYELADYIADLTSPCTHREAFTVRVEGAEQGWVQRVHVVRAPSLLEQLAAGDVDRSADHTADGTSGRGGFESSPAAHLDAVDTLAWIDSEATLLLARLDSDGSPPAKLLDPKDRTDQQVAADVRVWRIRRLHGQAPALDPVARRLLERDVRRWWIRARVVTGWDSRPWTPDNTCPICDTHGSLRVRLAEKVAACVHDGCRALWDPATIALLADHIRAESADRRRAEPGRGPCWCPVPEPDVADLSRLCPRCGSARCWHAVQARLLDSLRPARAAGG